jgi:glycosyltransferase involved in cell wall biosynthesis
MKEKALVSFGGPFPYDRSFRGQGIVQGDLIKEAVSRGIKSTVLSKYHEHMDGLLEKSEPMQKQIAEKAFSSELIFRYKSDFCDAKNRYKMAIQRGKTDADAVPHWGRFYGIDEVRKLAETHGQVDYFMHYYNSRFMDAEYFSKVMEHAKLGNAINAYYFIHVSPDQLVESEKDGGWKLMQNTGGAVESLVRAIDSGCFKRIIAVSSAARDMWLALIDAFGYPSATVDKAAKTIKAVPNGIDGNIYGAHYALSKRKELDEERAKLGFSPEVKKVVLVMTRPSISKGIRRIEEVLQMFNDSEDARAKGIGFLVTMPEAEGTDRFLEKTRGMKNLVDADRLKLTIDISKIVRNRPELNQEMMAMHSLRPMSYENERFYVKPIGYPLTYVSDVFLHLPYAEAFGLVVAEAMMSGCAVVTTDAGGIPEVTRNGRDSTILLKYDHMTAREAFDAVIELERPAAPNPALAEQFSLKRQFDNIVGDNDG